MGRGGPKRQNKQEAEFTRIGRMDAVWREKKKEKTEGKLHGSSQEKVHKSR